MTEERLNENYTDYFVRCSDCFHYRSYCFDEYDSDCWCDIFDDLKRGYCEKFEKNGDD